VSSGGAEGNHDSFIPSISAIGRFVAFQSDASDLVPGDRNGSRDVFVRDRETGKTKRVSMASGGAEANSDSYLPAISADGRFVAFESFARNLVGGDANRLEDIFVRDRRTGETELVSVGSHGVQGSGDSYDASISADGRFVAFESLAGNLVGGDANRAFDVFVRDRSTGKTRRISVSSRGAQANAGSHLPVISPGGRFVAFESDASNLVGGDHNGASDIFVRDRKTGATKRISVSSAGAEGNAGSYRPSISAAGRFVAFESDASNLVGDDQNGSRDVFVRGPLR